MSHAAADPLSEEGVETDEAIPRRRRLTLLTPLSAGLLAVVTCAVGFYGGIRVEKGQVASTPRTFAAATGGSGAARAGAASGSAGRSSAGAGGAGAGGGPGGVAGARGGGSGTASFGTVASVNGKTLVLTEASGDTVEVTLSSATKISKSRSVDRGSLHPGDTIIVSGVSTGKGTVSAATITDSGASTSGSSSSGAASSSSGSSGTGGGVSSLFGG